MTTVTRQTIKHDSHTKFIPSIVSSIVNSKNIVLNNPYHIRDFTPVQFVVTILNCYLNGKIHDNYFEVGTGIPQTTLSFVKLFKDMYCNYLLIDHDHMNIIVDQKPSSVISTSCAKQHPILLKFSNNYFQQLQTYTIKSLFNHD